MDKENKKYILLLNEYLHLKSNITQLEQENKELLQKVKELKTDYLFMQDADKDKNKLINELENRVDGLDYENKRLREELSIPEGSYCYGIREIESDKGIIHTNVCEYYESDKNCDISGMCRKYNAYSDDQCKCGECYDATESRYDDIMCEKIELEDRLSSLTVENIERVIREKKRETLKTIGHYDLRDEDIVEVAKEIVKLKDKK